MLAVIPGILLSCLILLPAVSRAQDDPGAEADFFAEAPLILTVSRMSKPLLESPASVSVIDRDMIRASGARQIADLFRLAPGFVVGYHSGHAPAVTYHGMGQEFGRQIQVLIDGRSVFIPSFGGVPWSNLPLLLQDIERIEIIRGPNAVTYGANAFLATINIITRHAAEDRGNYFSVTASDNANPDIEDAYLRFGKQSEYMDWRVSAGMLNDAGFTSINDSKRIGKLNLRVDLAPQTNQFWTLQTGASSGMAGRGFAQDGDDSTDIERNEEASNAYLNLSWEIIRDSSSTVTRLTHTRQEVIDHYTPDPFTFNGFAGVTTFIDFDRNSERSDFEVVQNEDIADDLRLVYGGSLRQDRIKSLFLLNRNSYRKVDTGRLFASAEWRFDQDWLLDVGAMLEDSSLTSREISPRLSLLRKLDQRHALRLVVSEARRNPILYEFDGETEFDANIPPFGNVVVPTWTGNDDIEPEKILSWEVGLRSQLEPGLNSDIKLFHYEISDQLVDAEVSVNAGPPLGTIPVASLKNEASTDVQGIEVSIDYRPDPRLELHTGLTLLAVDSEREAFEESFPEEIFFVSIGYRASDAHEISAAFYYLGEVTWIDSSSDIPISRRLDLRYAWRFADDMIFEVIGQNLLEDTVDYEDENIRDQIVFLRLSGGF